MSITKTAISSVDGIGVFTRDHRNQLEEAEQRDTDGLTTFRSKQTWRAVDNALNWRDDDIVVYHCPIDEKKIHYVSVIDDLLINPEEGSEEVKRFLKTDLESNSDDGLWGGEVDTFYRVKQFQRVEEPFSYTKLRKIADGEHIESNYRYSYSIVHQV